MRRAASTKIDVERAAAKHQLHGGVGLERPSAPEAVRHLQMTYGNQATLGILSRSAPPVTSGSLNDEGAHSVLPLAVRTVIGSGGEPLGPSVRTAMESRFTAEPTAETSRDPAEASSPAAEEATDSDRRTDADFSRVRIHTGERAATAARTIRARAFSVGSHIVFNAGEYQPDSATGRQLLAHELTHVSQPRTAIAQPFSRPGDASEREADAAANAVASGQVASVGATSGAIVQRQPEAGSTEAPALVRKKYLVLYDASDDEVKRQAEQTAKDHGTTARPFDPAKLGELTKKEQPDVIMTFGHGMPGAISLGTGLRTFRGEKTLTPELEKAGQTKPIRFVAQACSAGAEKGLMDTLQSTPSLKNYTFVSHTTGGHVTRNENIRVAGGASLPNFLIERFQVELGFDKASAAEIVRQTFEFSSKDESKSDASINTVIREISVLGFQRFWELTRVENPDVANDPSVLELNMTEEARGRFATGIGQFRARMLKAVEQQMKIRMKNPPAKPK
jgi:hypothetical protein